MAHNVLVAGAGKIGALITCMLNDSLDYQVTVVDSQFDGADISRLYELYPNLRLVAADVNDHDAMKKIIKTNKIKAVISSLPYFCNISVAKLAKENHLHYFDLTEDISVTQAVTKLAEKTKTAFVPQCGLAPGFISIVANSLTQHFEKLDSIKLRVGALPQNPNNALHYSLTWSTDGVINEYGSPCQAIENGKEVIVPPLEGVEGIRLDGLNYEAFNTSGGLGTLAMTYEGKVRNLNYKTIRYPGHCEKMRLLMNDLRLNEDRPTLKRILENAIPKTYQDVIVIYVSVTGLQKGDMIEENYMKKVYPQKIAGLQWSAIQITTAAGLCAVVDLVLSNPENYHGLVVQENFRLEDIISNRFGQWYK